MLWSARWSQAEESNFCVVHDITDRKIAEDLLRESESRLRTIMESMPVALVIASAQDGLIKATNQTTLELLEYPAMEQVVGCSLSKLIPAYEADSEDPLKMLEIMSLFPMGRLQAVKSTGAEVPVQISLKHFFYQGAPYILVTMLDMTERYTAEILKQEFVSMIRNDLKEPLLYVQSVLSTFANADRKRFTDRGRLQLQQSELEAERLLSLVTELLNAEQPQSSLHPKLETKMNSLAAIVNRSIEAVRLLAEKCKISIVNCTEECLLNSDHSRLIQVLVNLLANAIKFSPPNSTITVMSATTDRWIELRVIDQGRGIPASHRETIFDRFVQVESADAKVSRGIGLGLSICQSIVEAHNGTIGVDSEEGKGSSFWLRLPITAPGG
jgi:PAS domain S-box-containing protein